MYNRSRLQTLIVAVTMGETTWLLQEGQKDVTLLRTPAQLQEFAAFLADKSVHTILLGDGLLLPQLGYWSDVTPTLQARTYLDKFTSTPYVALRPVRPPRLVSPPLRRAAAGASLAVFVTTVVFILYQIHV